MFATGETVGLVEWIIDDTYLVFFTFLSLSFYEQNLFFQSLQHLSLYFNK